VADREAKVLIGVETDTAKATQGFADVGAAVDGLEQKVDALANSDAGAKLDSLPVGLRAAFQRAEVAADTFQMKLEQGAITGPRDLRKVTLAQVALTLEIERSGKTIDQLGPDAQRAYAKLEKAQKDAIITTSRVRQELDDVNVQTTAGVTGFTGFGNAIEQMGGKAGAAAEKLGFVAGAFTAGMAAGQAFNNFISTDMQAQETFMSLLALRMKGAIDGIFQSFLAASQGMVALAKGDWKTLNELSGDLKEGFDKVTGAITKTDAELYLLRDAMTIAADAAKAKADADTKLAEEQKKAAEEAKKLAEEQKKLKGELDLVTASIAAQTAELEKQRGIAESSTIGEDKATKSLAVAQDRVAELGDEIETARQRLADLTEQYGADSAAALNAAIDLRELEGAYDAAAAKADKLAKAAEDFGAAQELASEKADAAKTELEKLRGTQEKLAEQTRALAGETTSFDQKVGFAGASADKLSKAQDTLAGASDNVATKLVHETVTLADGTMAYSIRQVALTAAEIAANKAAAATDLHATKEATAKGAIDQTTNALDKLTKVDMAPLEKKVDGLVTKLNELVTAAVSAANAIGKLAGAGGDDDDGISIKRSSDGKELGKGDTLSGGFKGTKL